MSLSYGRRTIGSAPSLKPEQLDLADSSLKAIRVSDVILSLRKMAF